MLSDGFKICLGIIALIVLTIMTITNIKFVEKVEETWTYPEHVNTIENLAAKFSETRWPCEEESCLDEERIYNLSRVVFVSAPISGFSSELISGIIMVENPWLDSLAISSAGAIGLMQVMPFHRGFAKCGELETISGNICTGLAVLKQITLRRYNGCISEYCQDYPDHVEEAQREF